MSEREPFTLAERAILLERTAAIARRDETESERSSARVEAVFFRVGRQSCCAYARSIRGAIRLDGMVPVPHGGRTVAGAIVRSGNAIPVFHLAALVGDRIGRLPETAHGLLVGGDSDELALAVDAIDRFGDLDTKNLREPPEESRSRWVTAATVDGEIFVDLDALRDSPALWVDAKMTRTD
jgi:chemotaxis signal transduction protein